MFSRSNASTEIQFRIVFIYGLLTIELMKAGLIGAGLIGSALYKKLQSRGWNIRFVLRKSGLYENLDKKLEGNYLDYAQELDAAFLAIPTADDGSIASGYIKSFLEKGIPVITCEKGALSNHFASLESCLEKIGFSASVGGGTRLLSYLRGEILRRYRKFMQSLTAH